MNLDDLDLFFALPMFSYGQWFDMSVFPFNISLRFKSRQYMRIQYMDKSGERLCVCDMDHVYHLINPNRIEKVIFFDVQNQKKFKGDEVLNLIDNVNRKMKMNMSYSVPNSTLSNQYVEVSIDNSFSKSFKMSNIGKCYFSDLLLYFKEFTL